MYEATVTYQGQVTIPAPARKKLGIKSGSKLNFRVTDEGLVVSKIGGWETLQGVLNKFKDDYPTTVELASAHILGSGLKSK